MGNKNSIIYAYLRSSVSNFKIICLEIDKALKCIPFLYSTINTENSEKRSNISVNEI